MNTLLNKEFLKQFKEVKQSQDWFTVYDLGRCIYAILEPYQKQQVISYLICGENNAILLDTGLGIGNIKKLCFELWSILPTVINTNACVGHCGGNKKFSLVHIANEASIIDALTFGFNDEWVKKHFNDSSFSNEAPIPVNTEELSFTPGTFTTVDHGSIYSLGGKNFKVVSPKELSIHGLMLADDENKLLFTGDIFFQPLIDTLDSEKKSSYSQTCKTICDQYKDYQWFFSHGIPTGDVVKNHIIAQFA